MMTISLFSFRVGFVNCGAGRGQGIPQGGTTEDSP